MLYWQRTATSLLTPNQSSINQSINVKFAGRRYSLPADRVDFSSFAAFKQTIEQIDFRQFSFGYDN